MPQRCARPISRLSDHLATICLLFRRRATWSVAPRDLGLDGRRSAATP